ncbi:MAG TPA: hypothetical protein VH475_09395 [Tepidisphaeraceae bacterium]
MRCGRRTFRRYLRHFAILAGIALAAVALFNVLVDPNRTFGLYHDARLDAAKASRAGRLTKAEQLRHGTWDTVILGNSRVDCGIDPTSPLWPSPRTFNCGLTGLNFSEEAKVFEFLAQVVKPREVVLCLDFFHFQDAAPISDEFTYSRFNLARSSLAYDIDALWGATTTWHSILALNARFSKRPREYSEQGLRIKPMAPPRQTGRAAFEGYVSRAIESWRQEGGRSGDDACMQLFAQVLRSAARHGIRLTVIILPVHAFDLEFTRVQMGSLQVFEEWKRRLVKTIADVGRECHAGAPPVPLWDFTGFTGYVADPVAPPGDARAMAWYWEPSHFRRELGDLLIARIHGRTSSDGHDISHFGALIHESNIESHLARLRVERESFSRQYAEEIRFIEEHVHAANR